MFDVENLNVFVNRMFDNAIKSGSNVKLGLSNFRKYLADTSMCDDDYLSLLDKIISVSNELLELKRKMPDVNVVFVVECALMDNKKTSVPKKKKKTYSSSTADRCGAGSTITSSDRCGGSSSVTSDSCGGGSYTNRC